MHVGSEIARDVDSSMLSARVRVATDHERP